MTTISSINDEEKGEERNDDSESKTFENIDTSTPKRGFNLIKYFIKILLR